MCTRDDPFVAASCDGLGSVSKVFDCVGGVDSAENNEAWQHAAGGFRYKIVDLGN